MMVSLKWKVSKRKEQLIRKEEDHEQKVDFFVPNWFVRDQFSGSLGAGIPG
jgi:hypothetical protein